MMLIERPTTDDTTTQIFTLDAIALLLLQISYGPRIKDPTLWALQGQSLAPGLVIFVCPYISCNAVRGKMNDARVFAQHRALLECVLKGLSEVKPVNHHRLSDFG